jgi:hypothetical protein
MPTKLQANNKGQVLWYAKGHGWYISKWNLGYMSQTTHWTYAPDDLCMSQPPSRPYVNRSRLGCKRSPLITLTPQLPAY